MTSFRLWLFCVLSVITHTNSQSVDCGGDTCICPLSISGTTCTLNCNTEDVCKHETLSCRPGDPCEVICDAKATCSSGTIINGEFATDVTVQCTAEDSCKSKTSIKCGTGHCILQCIGSTACEDIGFVDTSNTKSFQCIGHCSNLNNVPAPFTATPTVSPTTKYPTISPTPLPTVSPTVPTVNPTKYPTLTPTTSIPSMSPTPSPTAHPTTSKPSISPTLSPTNHPTSAPTSYSVSWQETMISTIDIAIIASEIEEFSNNPTLSPSLAPVNRGESSSQIFTTNKPTAFPTIPMAADDETPSSITANSTSSGHTISIFIAIIGVLSIFCCITTTVLLHVLYNNKSIKPNHHKPVYPQHQPYLDSNSAFSPHESQRDALSFHSCSPSLINSGYNTRISDAAPMSISHKKTSICSSDAIYHNARRKSSNHQHMMTHNALHNDVINEPEHDGFPETEHLINQTLTGSPPFTSYSPYQRAHAHSATISVPMPQPPPLYNALSSPLHFSYAYHPQPMHHHSASIHHIDHNINPWHMVHTHGNSTFIAPHIQLTNMDAHRTNVSAKSNPVILPPSPSGTEYKTAGSVSSIYGPGQPVYSNPGYYGTPGMTNGHLSVPHPSTITVGRMEEKEMDLHDILPSIPNSSYNLLEMERRNTDQSQETIVHHDGMMEQKHEENGESSISEVMFELKINANDSEKEQFVMENVEKEIPPQLKIFVVAPMTPTTPMVEPGLDDVSRDGLTNNDSINLTEDKSMISSSLPETSPIKNYNENKRMMHLNMDSMESMMFNEESGTENVVNEVYVE